MALRVSPAPARRANLRWEMHASPNHRSTWVQLAPPVSAARVARLSSPLLNPLSQPGRFAGLYTVPHAPVLELARGRVAASRAFFPRAHLFSRLANSHVSCARAVPGQSLRQQRWPLCWLAVTRSAGTALAFVYWHLFRA